MLHFSSNHIHTTNRFSGFVLSTITFLCIATYSSTAQDGLIEAWGYNNQGQCNVPAPNSNFVAVAGGGLHSLAAKSLPVPVGACCVMGCIANETETACLAINGVFRGIDSLCSDVVCYGACCIGTGCLTLFAIECTSVGASFQGFDVTCAKVSCPTVCAHDTNGDGTANVSDLLDLIANWGACAP